MSEFNVENIRTVINAPDGYEYHRKPLILKESCSLADLESQDFTNRKTYPSDGLLYDMRHPAHFNAVGSTVQDPVEGDDSMDLLDHFPVIAVQGLVQVERDGKKALIRPVGVPEEQNDSYTYDSNLRDVLGDNSIELEVFEEPRIVGGTRDLAAHYSGSCVTALVLRSNEPETFASFSSLYGDLYIQSRFSESDHRELIEGLCDVGAISPQWTAMVGRLGMGVVWAPWDPVAANA